MVGMIIRSLPTSITRTFVFDGRSVFDIKNVSTIFIRSLFAETSASLTHILAPEKPVIDIVKCRQTGQISKYGESIVQFTWNQKYLYEWFIQYLGIIDYSKEIYTLKYAPISTKYQAIIIEVIDSNPGWSITSTSVNAITSGNNAIVVLDATGFVVGDYIRIGEESSTFEYSKITDIDGNKLILRSRVSNSYPSGTNVNEIQIDIKVKDSDYTLDAENGQLNMIYPTTWVNGSHFFSEYKPILTSSPSYALLLVPEKDPIEVTDFYDKITMADVKNGAFYEIDGNILGGLIYTDVLSHTFNGSDVTYYLFTMDEFGSFSFAEPFFIETIPSIPQFEDITINDQTLLVTWEKLPSVSDANTNGYNLYRSKGQFFKEDISVKINNNIIPKEKFGFIDGPTGTNRDSSIAFPENGSEYSYKMESEDTLTEWSSGTRNKIAETEEIEWAIK